MSMNSRLIEMISRVKDLRIVVIGDLILDSYIQGDTNRISPEAPIQVLDVKEERCALGGAGNVAANLRNLGVAVDLCSIIGDDAKGDMLCKMLDDKGIGSSGLVRDPCRPTTNKTRVVAHNQQLVRIDRETTAPPKPEVMERLLEGALPILKGADMVILSDYAKGVLTKKTIQKIVNSASSDCIADPKGEDYDKYVGCRLITPNRKEAEGFTGLSIHNRTQMKKAAEIIFQRVKTKEVVITLGAEGIYYCNQNGEDHLIPAEAKSVYDVTGAGDTVIALLAFCLASKNGLGDAVRIANVGAGLVVGKLGVAAPTIKEIKDAFSQGAMFYIDKILTRSQAAEISKNIEKQNSKLVFTNGCFDLLHGGHISYFRDAKKLGDYLMVAVNDDDSVRRLKGPTRPILNTNERMEILASLQVVDYVVSFSEDTPLEIIKEITPHVLIKGEDWREKGVVGQEWVEQKGGEVKLMPLRKGYSTSNLIERILKIHGKN